MELNELRLRTVKNGFVSGSFSLFSADDIKTICGLFMRTSSASASAKSSDVWQYLKGNSTLKNIWLKMKIYV